MILLRVTHMQNIHGGCMPSICFDYRFLFSLQYCCVYVGTIDFDHLLHNTLHCLLYNAEDSVEEDMAADFVQDAQC
jgi:hypothetical protein